MTARDVKADRLPLKEEETKKAESWETQNYTKMHKIYAHYDDFEISKEKLNYLFYIKTEKYIFYKDFHQKNLKIY